MENSVLSRDLDGILCCDHPRNHGLLQGSIFGTNVFLVYKNHLSYTILLGTPLCAKWLTTFLRLQSAAVSLSVQI